MTTLEVRRRIGGLLRTVENARLDPPARDFLLALIAESLVTRDDGRLCDTEFQRLSLTTPGLAPEHLGQIRGSGVCYTVEMELVFPALGPERRPDPTASERQRRRRKRLKSDS